MSVRGLKRDGGGRGDVPELGHWLDADDDTDVLRTFPCLGDVPLVAYGEYKRVLCTDGAVCDG